MIHLSRQFSDCSRDLFVLSPCLLAGELTASSESAKSSLNNLALLGLYLYFDV